MEIKLTEEEKKRIEKEIDCWKMHLESIDGANINISISKYVQVYVAAYSILMAVVIGIMSLPETELWQRSVGVAVLVIFFYITVKGFNKRNMAEIKKHLRSQIIRERMLRERYELLGVRREKLDKEFKDIKAIYENPNLAMIYLLTKEYYKKNTII